jgi:hypothetical protein
LLGFSFSDEYFETRRVAFELGIGDNDWIYENEEDWEEEDEGSLNIKLKLLNVIPLVKI